MLLTSDIEKIITWLRRGHEISARRITTMSLKTLLLYTARPFLSVWRRIPLQVYTREAENQSGHGRSGRDFNCIWLIFASWGREIPLAFWCIGSWLWRIMPLDLFIAVPFPAKKHCLLHTSSKKFFEWLATPRFFTPTIARSSLPRSFSNSFESSIPIFCQWQGGPVTHGIRVQLRIWTSSSRETLHLFWRNTCKQVRILTRWKSWEVLLQ